MGQKSKQRDGCRRNFISRDGTDEASERAKKNNNQVLTRKLFAGQSAARGPPGSAEWVAASHVGLRSTERPESDLTVALLCSFNFDAGYKNKRYTNGHCF